MASSAPTVRAGAGMRLLRTAVFTTVCVVLAAAGHSLASGLTVPGWSLAVGWVAVFAVVAPLAGRERTLPGIAALLAVGQLALHTVFNVGQLCSVQPGPAASGSATAGSSGGSLLAVAARLVCSDNGLRLTPQSARQVVANAGLDPSALSGAAPLTDAHAAAARMPGMVMPGHLGTHTAMVMPTCSLSMLLGHLLAAVVAGWLLRRGEAALWRLVRLSVRGAAELGALAPAKLLRRAHALLSAYAARAAVMWPRIRCTVTAAEAAGRHRTVWLRHCLARRGPPVALAAA